MQNDDTTPEADGSIASDAKPSTRLSRQQARMRLWQAKAAQAGSPVAGQVGHPKRRKPSMPKLPWNDTE